MDVDSALRLAGRAGRVDQHVGVVGGSVFRLAGVGLCRDDVVPPDITAGGPGHVRASAADDQDALDRGRLLQGRVGSRLHRDDRTAPVEAVGGDQQPSAGVVDPCRDGVGAVAGEHRHEDRANSTAGQRCDSRLGKHRQEDADAVTLADPQRAQGVGEAIDLSSQLAKGQRAGRAIVALPDERHLAGPFREMPVDGADDVVHPTADEPARPGRAGRQVEHCVVLARPDDAELVCHCAPEPGRIGGGAVGDLLPGGQPVGTGERQRPAAGKAAGVGTPGDGLGGQVGVWSAHRKPLCGQR